MGHNNNNKGYNVSSNGGITSIIGASSNADVGSRARLEAVQLASLMQLALLPTLLCDDQSLVSVQEPAAAQKIQRVRISNNQIPTFIVLC